MTNVPPRPQLSAGVRMNLVRVALVATDRDRKTLADIGATALVKGGVVTDHVTGDVLHDHDWTPMEAARAVVDALLSEGPD